MVKVDHPLRIDVAGEVIDIVVPHNFATLGWVLREARATFVASQAGKMAMVDDAEEFDALARGAFDGDRLDLGSDALGLSLIHI